MAGGGALYAGRGPRSAALAEPAYQHLRLVHLRRPGEAERLLAALPGAEDVELAAEL